MKRIAATFAILGLLCTTSCANYHDADGTPEYVDSACSSGICPLIVIAALAGLGAAIASHH